MQALQFSTTGDLASLQWVEVPTPVPGADQVLVRIKAAGLNPSDVKNVLGRFPYTTVPRIPGRDFAGVVEQGPAELLGQAVWGTGKELGFFADGSHAQYVVLAAKGVARKPTHLSFAQAASLGVPYTTAWDALERSGVASGTRLMVIGGGAVATAALALAKVRGAQVLAAARRPEQVRDLQSQGYHALLLEQPETLAEQVNQVYAGGAEVIFDTTGFWLPAAVPALATFGRIAIIAAPWTAMCNCRPWPCIARAARWWGSTRCCMASRPARRCWSSSAAISMKACCRCRKAWSSRRWSGGWSVMPK